MVTSRLGPFGTSIFAEMTALAVEHGAINLAQGFPDFDGPPEALEAAVEALRSGRNQYARSMGVPELTEAIAAHQRAFYGLDLDPATEVTVTSGATEGIAAALLGLLEPGDAVVSFEPFYDSYPAVTALAGAEFRCSTLSFPAFEPDLDELAALLGDGRARVLVLNNPHNPTGRVFTRAELERIGELCLRHDLVVLADEVYEHLTYDGARHLPIACLPGMRERTLTLGSAGKTLSLTGWKVGWATGPRRLVAAAQAAHQFLTFCTATPLQHAVARALPSVPGAFAQRTREEFTARRDLLVGALREAGFDLPAPQGTYFALAAFGHLWDGDDRSLAEHLVRTAGVAAIPPSVFYARRPEEGRRLLRFAFCKRLETLETAAERLRAALAPRA